jgi:hypothetical protein
VGLIEVMDDFDGNQEVWDGLSEEVAREMLQGGKESEDQAR